MRIGGNRQARLRALRFSTALSSSPFPLFPSYTKAITSAGCGVTKGQSMTYPHLQLRSLAIAAVACLSFAACGLAVGGAVKDCILVNHVGFVPRGAKYCVVINPPAKEFSVVQGWGGKAVLQGQLRHANADLGDGWVGDFSSVRDEGVYTIHCARCALGRSSFPTTCFEQPLRRAFQLLPHSTVRRQPQRLARPLPSGRCSPGGHRPTRGSGRRLASVVRPAEVDVRHAFWPCRAFSIGPAQKPALGSRPDRRRIAVGKPLLPPHGPTGRRHHGSHRGAGPLGAARRLSERPARHGKLPDDRRPGHDGALLEGQGPRP